MPAKTKTLLELKDSKLLYEKDMPLFGYFIITAVVLLLAVVTFWGAKTDKPYIVKGTGTVESPNKNYVMPLFTGEIDNVSMEEGQYVNKGDVLFTVKSTDFNMQDEQIQAQKAIYEKQIVQYGKLVDSIKNNQNYFSESNAEDSLYYNQYETYKNQVQQQTVDTVSLKQYGYSDAQIQQELEKNDKKKAELYYSAISNAEGAKSQAQAELDTLESQLTAMETGEKDYEVKATSSGVLHMLSVCKDGMVVQAASPVASIGSNLDEYIITSFIDAGDRSRIEEKDKVKIEVAGLQQNIYGTISGYVSNIDSDITTTEDGKSYFKIEVSPNRKYLISKEGKKVNLTNGLQVETRIIYDEVTYLEYLLDALGVKN